MGIAKPSLVFWDAPLEVIAKSRRNENTLVITDEHNYEVIGSLFPVLMVERPKWNHVMQTRRRNEYIDVLAIGGCSALDYGRACASREARVTLIPTILSTSCISVNRSVLYFDNGHRVVKTTNPDEVIISLSTIMQGDRKVTEKWCHSGLGDLLSGISASINTLWKNRLLSDYPIRDYAVGPFQALDWILFEFRAFDRDAVVQIAHYLHNASLDVIELDNMRATAAGEHDLYHEMVSQQRYSPKNPTHGELVSIGTLLTTKAFERLTGKNDVYQQMRAAFQRIGLPTTFEELSDINIKEEHLVAGLKAIAAHSSFLGWSYAEIGNELLNDCYGG